MVRTILILSLLCFSLLSNAQSLGSFKDLAVDGQQMTLTTDKGEWRVTIVDTHIVKLDFLPDGMVRPNHSAAVLPDVGAPVNIVTQRGKRRKELYWANYSLTYQALADRIILWRDGYTVTQTLGHTTKDSNDVLVFELADTEELYGGGARALPMSRVGLKLPLYNKPQYGYDYGWPGANFSMPMFVSSKGYAILLDNPAKGTADLGVDELDQYYFEMEGGPLTWYWILGRSPKHIVTNYTQLTGRQPMPPKWALGNFASRFGYQSEAQARAVVDSFQRAGIPLDAIVIDLYWFGKGVKDSFNMGNLSWDNAAWPDPAGMIADFKAKGVKTILITEPFILTTSSNYDEAVSLGLLGTDTSGNALVIEDFWFGPAGLLDMFKPAARDWFWAQYKKQIDIGVAGWWGDLGEPEKHPDTMQHVAGSANEIHNAYGHWWSKMVYEGYTNDYPNQRLFHLNRSGFAGSQRYASYPWSGDVARNWSGLKAQVPIMLGMGWCGMPYMHSDLGGFAGDKRDAELYVRWLQMGVFSPIFRPHGGGDVPSEPIYWDAATMASAKTAIELRYQLIPYNYHLAWEAEQYGWPLARPMAFYTNDPLLQNVDNQYFWGRDMIVAPVIEAGAKAQAVTFPEGSGWYDWYTGKAYKPGTTAVITINLDHIPVFVREGSVIPMRPTYQHMEAIDPGVWSWRVYLDKKGDASTRIFQDDGTTPGTYEKAAYYFKELAVTYDKGADDLAISIDNTGPMREMVPEMEQATINVFGLSAPPATISVNDKPEAVTWVDVAESTAESPAVWDPAHQIAILRVGWINR